MNSPNHFHIIGNLTKDPELKSTKSGKSVCQIGLATNKSIKTDDGYEDKAVYFNFSVFGKMAETMSDYLNKGSKIYIEGELDMSDKWEDKEGNTHYPELRLNVRSFSFLDSKPKGDQPMKKKSTKQEESEDDGWDGPF